MIRQTNVGPDLELLGDCVSAIGHTVLLLEPWNDPQPLKRAYCIKEVYHTQVSEYRVAHRCDATLVLSQGDADTRPNPAQTSHGTT